jgi:hypothetical protein
MFCPRWDQSCYLRSSLTESEEGVSVARGLDRPSPNNTSFVHQVTADFAGCALTKG